MPVSRVSMEYLCHHTCCHVSVLPSCLIDHWYILHVSSMCLLSVTHLISTSMVIVSGSCLFWRLLTSSTCHTVSQGFQGCTQGISQTHHAWPPNICVWLLALLQYHYASGTFSTWNICVSRLCFSVLAKPCHTTFPGVWTSHLSYSCISSSVQFNSVTQSCPTLWDPWTAAHQASLSITNSWSLLKLVSIELVMPSNHLILCHPLLPPLIFRSIRVFSNESALHIR